MSVAMRFASLAPGLAFVLASTAAWPVPSFDCNKAESETELLICGDGALAWQDMELSAIYERILKNAGSKRAVFAASQNRWLADRDALCARDKVVSEADQKTCVADAYGKRIAELKPLQPGAKESLLLCGGVLTQYRTLLEHDPKGPYGADGTSPGIIEKLAADPASEFVLAPELSELRSFTQPELPDAAEFMAKRFSLDQALRQRVAPEGYDGSPSADALWITRLPQTNAYGVVSMAGTMRCETLELMVEADAGAARLIETPLESEGSCASAQFGIFGKQPVLITGDYSEPVEPRNYHLIEGYSFHPWREGWMPACNVSLTYAPVMSYAGRSSAGAHAESGDKELCAKGDTGGVALREAVLALMRRYQEDPLTEPQKLLAELDAGERKAFLHLKTLSDQQAGAAKPGLNNYVPADYASLPIDLPSRPNHAIPLAYSPVALPLMHEGEMMLVLAGHFSTTGSRDLPDYAVSVKRLREQSAQSVANFIITLGFGKVRNAKVSLR
jgi:uncharacterized protein